MPRGILTKVDMESYLYKLKQELQFERSSSKDLADKYLNKVIDKIKEFRE